VALDAIMQSAGEASALLLDDIAGVERMESAVEGLVEAVEQVKAQVERAQPVD